jgi:polyribonucleotide nucleotidyltransferase
MQMDIKLGGIELDVLKKALLQAKEAKLHILELMEDASKDIIPSSNLPLKAEFKIDPSKSASVIGKAGSVIREIIEKFDVSIDLDRDNGNIKVNGQDKKILIMQLNILKIL